MDKDAILKLLKQVLTDTESGGPGPDKTLLALAVLALAQTLSDEFPLAQLLNRRDDEKSMISDDSAKTLMRAQAVRLVRELPPDAVSELHSLFTGLFSTDETKVLATMENKLGLQGENLWDAAAGVLQRTESRGDEEAALLSSLASAIPGSDTFH
jgi:hypothetical protein